MKFDDAVALLIDNCPEDIVPNVTNRHNRKSVERESTAVVESLLLHQAMDLAWPRRGPRDCISL